MKSYVFQVELAHEDDGRWSTWIDCTAVLHGATLRKRHCRPSKTRQKHIRVILTAILGSRSHEASQSRKQSCHLGHAPMFLRLLWYARSLWMSIQDFIRDEAHGCL